MACCCSPNGAGPGGVIAPLTPVFFSQVGAAAGGNGSIATPFNTFAAGRAAVVAAGGGTLVVVGDFSAEGAAAFVNIASYRVWGWSPDARMPTINTTNVVPSRAEFINVAGVVNGSPTVECHAVQCRDMSDTGSNGGGSWLVTGDATTVFSGTVFNLHGFGGAYGALTATIVLAMTFCALNGNLVAPVVELVDGCGWPTPALTVNAAAVYTQDPATNSSANTQGVVYAGVQPRIVGAFIQPAFGATAGAVAADTFLGQYVASLSAIENNRKFPAVAGTWSRGRAYTTSGGNITVANCIITLRKNGANTAQVVTINNGAAVGSDLVNRVSFVEGDFVSVRITGNGTTIPGPGNVFANWEVAT